MNSQSQSKTEEKTILENAINELLGEKKKKEQIDRKKKGLIDNMIAASHKD